MSEREDYQSQSSHRGDIDDVDTPDYYANNTYVTIGRSDVTIWFGRTLEGADGRNDTSKSLARVTLTHENFAGMVRYWSKFSGFLTDIYDGAPPSTAIISQQKIDAALVRHELKTATYITAEDDEE
ncbi:MAG: hypothetical protein ACLQVD_15155 [Capsulimonadaceae bacterium]